jgi:hypothetical protein
MDLVHSNTQMTKYRNMSSNSATTTLLHIFSNSLFTDHTIRRCIVWAACSSIK